MPDVVDNPLRLVGNAAARLRLRTRPRRAARPGRRDRLGQGRCSPRRRPMPTRRASAGREISTAPEDGGRGLRRVRAGQAAQPALIDFADLLLIMAGAHRGVRRRRRGDPRAGTGTSSSTSTRTSRRCSSACSTPGSATAPTCAWSATPTRRSTPSPAPRPTTCSAFVGASRTRCSSGSTATTAPLPRSSRWPTQLVRAQAGGERLTLAGQRPDGPEPTLRRVRRRAGRGGATSPPGAAS